MGERLNHKKRQGGGVQIISSTTAQDTHHNRSFEITDSKYNSQNMSNSRSKTRAVKGTSGSSRSKEKLKQQQITMNIEELKKQILIKQALIDSNKNSRRKSAGGVQSAGSASQTQQMVN